jgi:UDP-N-acetylglucosamine/UDP-N-acetylgalactosamine diphosphorylase
MCMVDRFERSREVLERRGQGHVLRFWDELGERERGLLLTDVESVPWELLDGLIDTHVLHKPPPSAHAMIEPAEVFPLAATGALQNQYRAAVDAGRGLIASGKVAAFTVAGGQGTRLGFDGPKGAVAVTPAGNRTLFEIFAITILAARRRYRVSIPWYVMTSAANHEETASFLRDHDYFGLPVGDVTLFRQGMLPAVGFDGKLLLETTHRLALSPDGHGGSLKAMVQSGALSDMRKRGVEIISYFQVDNPLVKPFDPLFIGLHAATGSEMSTKVARKADDLEKVGNVVRAEGKVTVIEYSELPEELARARNPDGTRRFDFGNLAIHLLDVDFVDRIVGRSFQLPFRRAEKIVPNVDERGRGQKPENPNAVKLETFVFDALPLAENPLVLEVDRAEEFSPVKNATGADSLETAKRDQTARACRWLEAAGVEVPRQADGEPDVTVAISPLLALGAEDVKTHVARIPELRTGDCVYIE